MTTIRSMKPPASTSAAGSATLCDGRRCSTSGTTIPQTITPSRSTTPHTLSSARAAPPSEIRKQSIVRSSSTSATLSKREGHHSSRAIQCGANAEIRSSAAINVETAEKKKQNSQPR